MDTNAVRWLVQDSTRDRVAGAMRASGATLWFSAINVLEILKTEDERVRSMLLAAIKAMGVGRPLLPLPMLLLKQVVESIARGQQEFTVQLSGLERLIDDPASASQQHRLQARELLRRNQDFWDARYREGRRNLRRIRREGGTRDPWGSISVFLEEHWMTPAVLGEMVERMLRALDLDPSSPLEPLLSEEAWRLYLESMGAAIYERCVLDQPPKPVHIPDLLQLVYLSGSAQRILVTDDGALRRIAKAFVLGRYGGARIMTTAEFLGTAA